MALGVSLSLGTSTTTTQAAADNSTKLATTAYADAISAGGGGITQLTGDVTAGPGSGAQAATIPAASVGVSKLSATGTPSSSTYLRGDNTWSTPAGGSTPAEVLITETVVGVGGASSVSFTSIAATWRDLRVVVRGRGTNASANVSVLIRVNNDSSAIYDYERFEYNNGTNFSSGFVAQTSWQIGYITAANAPSGVSSAAEARIYDYRGTAFHKTMTAASGVKATTGTPAAGDLYADRFTGWYRSTTAITRVDALLSAGSFAQDSVVSLYGIL